MAVRNDDGDVIEQVRVKNTDLEEIAQRYAGGEALLEATTNYFYIYDMLTEYLDVVVGHPSKLKAIAQTDKKPTGSTPRNCLGCSGRVPFQRAMFRLMSSGVPRTRARPD